jgi:hypothetical protein
MVRCLLAILVLAFTAPAAAHPSKQVADSRVEPTGPPAEVEWNGSWYPATVLGVDGERTLIHYVGYGENWDEWVGPERIRVERPPAVIAHAGWRVGQSVEVEWGSTWWKATVVATDSDRTLIHYAGYGDQWDEWVTDSRIR